MSMSRRSLVITLGIVFIAAFALLYTVNTVRVTDREFIHRELQKLFGKGASLDDLRVTLWGGIGFSAKDFRVADHPRFAANPLLHARELKLGLSLAQLLLGRVVVNSLTLYEPELQIITDEEGLLNLEWQKKELEALRLARSMGGKNHTPVAFRITRLEIKGGTVDFIDRSVREPAEMQIKNVEMDVRGLLLSGRTRIKLAAAITGGLGHDVRIEGTLGSFVSERGWSQEPLELDIQCDSLQIPMITRALPFFRDKIPRELDVTGPLSLRAKLGGTVRQPRITEFRLRAPLFGASDYNAILTGTADLVEDQSWTESQIRGKLVLNPVDLAAARKVSFLREILPPELDTRGTIGVYSQFEGSLQNLRAGVLVQADQSEIRYDSWVRKPRGTPARWQAQVSRQQDSLVLHNSVLMVGPAKLALSGIFDDRLHRWELKLATERHRLAAWEQLFSPASYLYPTAGMIEADILLKRDVTRSDGWDIQGKVNVDDAEFTHKQARQRIDQANLSVSFLGKQALFEKASFRLGSSNINVTGAATITKAPVIKYELRSPDLNLPDLAIFAKGTRVRLKSVAAEGQIHFHDGTASVEAVVTSPEGMIEQVGYRDARAEFSWAPTGTKIKHFSAQALNGKLHSAGFWSFGPEEDPRLELSSEMDSIDVRDLLNRAFPRLQREVGGELSFKGRFTGTTTGDSILEETLAGEGEAEVHNGFIKDFNLVAQLLSRRGGSNDSELPAQLATLLNHPDMSFDVLHATVTIERQRIRMPDLSVVTPDYTLTAAGWIGFDRVTKWNGLLVLSPHLTRDIQQAYGSVRLLVNRRGRLALPFRMEGRLPDLKVSLDNRALVQNFRRGSPVMPEEPRSGGSKRDAKRTEWLPDSLKQLLNR